MLPFLLLLILILVELTLLVLLLLLQIQLPVRESHLSEPNQNSLHTVTIIFPMIHAQSNNGWYIEATSWQEIKSGRLFRTFHTGRLNYKTKLRTVGKKMLRSLPRHIKVKVLSDAEVMFTSATPEKKIILHVAWESPASQHPADEIKKSGKRNVMRVFISFFSIEQRKVQKLTWGHGGAPGLVSPALHVSPCSLTSIRFH